MARAYVFVFIFLLANLIYIVAGAQPITKIVAECTITYAISIEGNTSGKTIKALYIKGKKTRSEISNSSFTQATIFDNKEVNAVVMKEIGGDKYISFFTAAQWKEKNNIWDSATVSVTNDTRTILNFTCRKAVIQTKSGSRYNVYYTTALAASATENPYQFKNITGLILEYESENKEGRNIEYKATDISFIPVPAAKFAIPTSGYRVVK